MLDDATTKEPIPSPHCTWCSAELPSDHETTCPSCGATLLGDGDPSVPGLTAIDAEAILRNARTAKTKPRGRLLSWISGEYDDGDGEAAAAPGSLAPPPPEVRREILRLELDAQVANAQAEVESMAADAAVEEGLPLDGLAAAAPDEGAPDSSDMPAAAAADLAPDAHPAEDLAAPPEVDADEDPDRRDKILFT